MVATKSTHYVPLILQTIEDAAKVRGIGHWCAERKIRRNKCANVSDIALYKDEFAGFAILERGAPSFCG